MSNLCNVLTHEDKDILEVIFKYEINAHERLFTFKRKKNEILGDMVKRMKINFQKAFNKGKKKATDVELKFCFFHDNEPVDLAIQNDKFWIDDSEMHIDKHIYIIKQNYPTISDIQLPNIILAGFPVYPVVEMINGEISKSKFTWYRKHKTSSGEWQMVGELFCYQVVENDLECELKVVGEPGNGQQYGLSKEALSSKPLERGPVECPFQSRHGHTSDPVGFKHFRVVSYNLLANIYADSDYSKTSLFSYCKPKFLDFDYRKQLILKEIIGYNGDIYFLQEVDQAFYLGGLKPLMKIYQYESHFLSKPQMVEGLAILYSESKFSLVHTDTKVFADLLCNFELFAKLKTKVAENSNLFERISKLKNSFQALLLRSKDDPNQLLLGCNLHLYSKDDADHIRLIQSYICLKYLEHMLDCFQSQEQYSDCEISVLISGDFNSTPEFGVVKLVKERKIDSLCEDFKSNEQEIIDNFTWEHRLNLDTACGFPDYTNFTQGFIGCLDYIFYDVTYLEVVDIVPMPSHEAVSKEIAIPNETFPSDHIALICTLRWKE